MILRAATSYANLSYLEEILSYLEGPRGSTYVLSSYNTQAFVHSASVEYAPVATP